MSGKINIQQKDFLFRLGGAFLTAKDHRYQQRETCSSQTNQKIERRAHW